MEQAKKKLERAFDLLNRIPVSGQYVEIMCAARNELREAYKLLEEGEDG